MWEEGVTLDMATPRKSPPPMIVVTKYYDSETT